MKILFIGDIVGKSGRQVLTNNLHQLKEEYQPDMTIVNCENAAAGFGVTPKIAQEFFELGCDVLTSGNHIWDRKEVFDYIGAEPRLIRPHNFPADTPGNGFYIHETESGKKVTVINVMGQVFMAANLYCPFRTTDKLLHELENRTDIILVDFHAEASSEKQAFAHYLDGRVAAVLGTHTHVPTADERIFPKGTAYISDVGMTGNYNSVIGMDPQPSLNRFLTKLPQRLEVAEGPAELCGVVIDVDDTSGLSHSISRVKC